MIQNDSININMLVFNQSLIIYYKKFFIHFLKSSLNHHIKHPFGPDLNDSGYNNPDVHSLQNPHDAIFLNAAIRQTG